ncbi:DUF4382 domain-containing protein [Marinoscillum furvescens]|uniref:Uncharacterized protein DUF4382 n=1 Tax=Marinoscillum furvescens DSM 4134 TaxID=1122208 RepID=A0A3D9L040_MARFU|nr:DUF4382 domain-containing protein [Marinoscillum furvescens]RED93903.1 uncharacterized protein DUF4382 [Marinoscillum furvescens DSM 4134]
MREIKNLIAVITLIATAIMFQSCTEDEVGAESTGQAQMEMKAVTTNGTTSSGRTLTTGFTFTEVMVGVTEIEFETLEEEELEEGEDGEEVEAEDEEIEYEGRFIVDLLAGTSNPDFGLAALSTGTYQEIEVEMEPILEGNQTVRIKLFFEDASTSDTVYVEFETSEELEFEFEDESGFTIDAGAVNAILIQLDLDKLFAGVDLSSATADEDGVIRITDTSNEQLTDMLVDKLEDAMEAEEEDEEDDEEDESDND